MSATNNSYESLKNHIVAPTITQPTSKKKGEVSVDSSKKISSGGAYDPDKSTWKFSGDAANEVYANVKQANQPFTKDKATVSDYDKITKNINKSIFLDESGPLEAFQKMTKYYNRFKVPLPDTQLIKGFAHVFFVRPSCYIFNDKNAKSLRSDLKNNELFQYAFHNNSSLLRELTHNSADDISHDFMLTLSNMVGSFSLSDEYINTDAYGRSVTGFKISYGKSIVESQTNGTFTITYKDDKYFSIYQLHRLWVKYISHCYRGEIEPKASTIKNKILDYASAVYYIITAEDGETILFWSKYFGVFPSSIPSQQYSWSAENNVTNPSIDITYQFSFKEDFNPYSIYEFNHNSHSEKIEHFEPAYSVDAYQNGPTWVGRPYIQLVKDDNSHYYYKLRFSKKE